LVKIRLLASLLADKPITLLRQISRQGWGIKDVLAKSLPSEARKRHGQMRSALVAILAIGMVSAAAPARAQAYDPISQFACKPTAPLATTSTAALQHWLSAMLRPRAARHNATPILLLRARESPRVIGGIAAPTKTYSVNRCAYPASDLFAITRSREPLKLRDQ
jgi:hypothetical protein